MFKIKRMSVLKRRGLEPSTQVKQDKEGGLMALFAEENDAPIQIDMAHFLEPIHRRAPPQKTDGPVCARSDA